MKITFVEKNGCKYVTGVSLPKRARESHKYNYGCDLVIGGCTGYTGAPYYSAEAASRAGAGLVMMGVPDNIYVIEAVKARSAMPFPLPCDEDGRLAAGAVCDIEKRFPKTSAMLIGPGLGLGSEIEKLVAELAARYSGRIILDADGINAAARHIDILGSSEKPMILTPHTGEFARLGGDLGKNKAEAAAEFSKKHRCVTVLKGPDTVTAFPDGDVYINTTGSPALAKGGSGDVLAGIMLAFIGRGFDLKAAVPGAVYVHGLCGDIAAGKFGEESVLPPDLIDAIPMALSAEKHISPLR